MVHVLGMKRLDARLVQHDNAPSHSSLIVTEFLAKDETTTRDESIEAIKSNSLKDLKAYLEGDNKYLY